jgi:hypothetical protein
MTPQQQPSIGPVWRSFVDHVQRSITDHGQTLDVEIIGMDGIEGLERLQSQAGMVAFADRHWTEVMSWTREPDPATVAALLSHPGARWWFQPIHHEHLVVQPEHPAWLRGGWWLEPNDYPTISQAFGGDMQIVRHYCADEHSDNKPIAVHRLPSQYCGDRRFTINSPEDWTTLVDRHPTQHSVFRSHVFQQFDQLWIPNWQSVAADIDLVTLTVGGFAHTAYLPLVTPAGRNTMLCGWNPGESVVLNPWWQQ